jgi:hypothetical protein
VSLHPVLVMPDMIQLYYTTKEQIMPLYAEKTIEDEFKDWLKIECETYKDGDLIYFEYVSFQAYVFKKYTYDYARRSFFTLVKKIGLVYVRRKSRQGIYRFDRKTLEKFLK